MSKAVWWRRGRNLNGITPQQPSGNTDPYFANVVLLCGNDNKADATTVFADQSPVGRSLTPNDGIQYDTAQAATGMTSSILCDGNRDFLSALDSSDWDFGSGDFTVEAYVRFNVAPTVNAAVFDQLISIGGTNRAWLFAYSNAAGTNGQGLEFVYSTTGANQTFIRRDGTLNLGTWYHVACSRSGSNLFLWLDGVQLGATANVSGVTIFNSSKVLGICGSAETSGFDTNGWYNSMRITKGVARYTAPFTPPSLPMPITS